MVARSPRERLLPGREQLLAFGMTWHWKHLLFEQLPNAVNTAAMLGPRNELSRFAGQQGACNKLQRTGQSLNLRSRGVTRMAAHPSPGAD